MTSVKKNFFYNGLLLLSNLLFPIINFAYASRVLGPAGIGKVQFVVIFATYFVVIAQLGIPVYGMREVAKARGDKKRLDKLFSELLFINLLSSLSMAVIYGVLIFSIGWFHDSLNYYLLGGLLILSGFSVLDWFYMGMEQFRFLSLRSIVIKVVALTVLFLFVRTPENLMIYFLITIFSILSGKQSLECVPVKVADNHKIQAHRARKALMAAPYPLRLLPDHQRLPSARPCC